LSIENFFGLNNRKPISTFLLLNVKYHTESNGATIFLKFALDSLQILIYWVD